MVPSDAEIIERLLRFDDSISARGIMSYDMRVSSPAPSPGSHERLSCGIHGDIERRGIIGAMP